MMGLYKYVFSIDWSEVRAFEKRRITGIVENGLVVMRDKGVFLTVPQ